MKTVFLDSSVFFSAVNSPSGGSAKLFTIKDLKLVTSSLVLAEVERNVYRKLTDIHLERFFMLTAQVKIYSQEPDNRLIANAKKVIVEKDAFILAEAKQSKARYIVTLDKKHFFTTDASTFVKPQKIMTPKMIIAL